MPAWPDRRILDLFGIELPIIQAPMAGSVFSEMVIAVSEAGGLGSLSCAMLSVDQARTELLKIRAHTSRPINVNFFCHRQPPPDPARESLWRRRLEPYYTELGIDTAAPQSAANRAPFDRAMCEVVLEFRPEVVSFHFGLPERELLDAIRGSGPKIISSATTVDEARWLEQEGCDAIIAQGYEAGGHRGMFLTEDLTTQIGMMALVPQVVDAVKVPVIAAGGIGDARGIAAAFALGASAVQLGTSYQFCPEANISLPFRTAIKNADDDETAITNIFSGRPARGIMNRLMRELGPISDLAPEFPLASGVISPLRAKAEAAGSGDFSPLWAGQAVRMGRETSAGELTRRLAEETLVKLRELST